MLYYSCKDVNMTQLETILLQRHVLWVCGPLSIYKRSFPMGSISLGLTESFQVYQWIWKQPFTMCQWKHVSSSIVSTGTHWQNIGFRVNQIVDSSSCLLLTLQQCLWCCVKLTYWFKLNQNAIIDRSTILSIQASSHCRESLWTIHREGHSRTQLPYGHFYFGHV